MPEDCCMENGKRKRDVFPDKDNSNDTGDRAGNRVNPFGGRVSDRVSEWGSRVRIGARAARKPLYKILFSRFFLTVLFILLQIGFFLYVFAFLNNRYSQYVLQGGTILAVLVLIGIINGQSSSAYKMSWAILVAALPVLGVLLYSYTHLNVEGRRTFANLNRNIRDTADYAVTSLPVRDRVRYQDRGFRKLSDYMERIGGFPTYENTEVRHYPLGDDAFADLCEELEKAEVFIFLEYFIIEEGVFWDTILEILLRKSAEGVEVRLLFDDLGCAQTLPRNYYRTMNGLGIACRTFGRIKPLFSTAYNNRDHRKILVIDGRVAFSGGINLADEYINEVEKYGHWKDCVFRLRGDAVRSCTLMFLQMWNIDARESAQEDYAFYLEGSDRTPDLSSDGFLIPYGDGPHRTDRVAENVYIDIINHASRHVFIMTPYLIPDAETLHAIRHAALSGVEVDIILPGIPDKKLISLISKSYYAELLRSDVHIYEYSRGFVHSKMVTADAEIAAEGSVNLDFRSLYLHYECGCVMYKNSAVAEIEEDVRATLELCREVTWDTVRAMNPVLKLVALIFRVFAPLL